MSKLPTHLLWVDLETTGSEETQGDEILEIAAIMTDERLRTMWEFERVILPTEVGMKRLMANDYVRQMHEKNGLLKILETHTLYGRVGVEKLLITSIQETQPKAGRVALAGSGVGHFDARFLRMYMPNLMSHLTYYVLDTGVLRRFAQLAGVEVPPFDEGKTHRAMDDVRCHLREGQWFLDTLHDALVPPPWTREDQDPDNCGTCEACVARDRARARGETPPPADIMVPPDDSEARRPDHYPGRGGW